MLGIYNLFRDTVEISTGFSMLYTDGIYLLYV